MKNNLSTEVHVHTLVSHHAYSTVGELVQRAKELGISLLAITDHGPATRDGADAWHFMNLKVLPRKIGDLYLLKGAEVNIIDFEGTVDLPENLLKRLDWVIASIHSPCFIPGTVKDHTNTYIKALENPYIDALGHSGSPDYAYDIDAVLETAKRYDKAIELNNHSFFMRKKSIENCRKIARRCAELGVNVVLSTDAHSVFDLGENELCWNLAMEAGIREEQIVNLNAERFLNYLCRRKGFDRERFENTKPE
ncbi:MAG: phosphatase [Clostridia bacterium]|nr:phosphatase [Clostridia bacterium]